MLLNEDAYISVKNAAGMTSLMIASQRGHLDVVPALKNWPVTMFIVVLQELVVYHLLDIMSFFDLVEYIG